MKVLIVEDEDSSLELTLMVVRTADATAEISTARDRDTALCLLDDLEFDLIICDLKIPPSANDLDANEIHGLAVHAKAQEVCPGTPLIFLTGKATPTNVQRQLSYGAVTDYYGMGEAPMVQLAVKDGRRQEVGYITSMAEGLRSLEGCSVLGKDVADVSDLLIRAVRGYARLLAAREVNIELLSGLSGAEVARAVFRMENGQTRALLVKLQPRDAARDERTRYDLNVPNKLRHGYFAPSAAAPIEYGLRKQAALFYTLAAQTRSLFNVAAEDPQRAAEIVKAMEVDHSPWSSEYHGTEVNLGELRRARIADGDPRAAALFDRAWREEVEALDLELRVCTTHGDLHGLNVLVDPSDRATLIDYGDVGLASAALDPITLEMSFLFHREGPQESRTRALRQLENWTDVEAFIDGSHYAPVLRQCRGWANRMAPTATVLATAYVHAARQVKYSDVRDEEALAVAYSAGRALLDLD